MSLTLLFAGVGLASDVPPPLSGTFLVTITVSPSPGVIYQTPLGTLLTLTLSPAPGVLHLT